MSHLKHKIVIFLLKRGDKGTNMKYRKYRSIGCQSIGDTDTKNRADTADTSIPLENATGMILR